MPNKKDPWRDRHSANVVRYAVPLIFGDRPHPSDPVHQNLGTGVIVEAGEGAFLITAAHVLEHAQGRATEPRFHFMVGPVELGLGRVKRRRWLYEALLDAVDHEQDRLQGLAPLAAYGARTSTVSGDA